MKHRVPWAVWFVALMLGLGPGVRSVRAQVQGIPVYNSGVPRGIAVYGDVGFPDENAGKGTAFAVSGRAGFGPFGATAILSTFNPDGPGSSDVSVGATLNYKIFGGPLVPLSVTLQGGIGYSKPDNGLLPGSDATQLHFPVGVGFALTIPNPALAIRPWIAPRVDIVHASVSGTSDSETNFGLGGGLELNLLNGFGLHAAYDRVFVDGGDPSVFGIGAHYAFRIPGL
jgi:outer membrane protein with beta-barrel domain